MIAGRSDVRRSIRRLTIGCAFFSLTLADQVLAREPSGRLPVDVHVDPCTGVPAEFVGHVMRVELGVTVNASTVSSDAPEPAQKPVITTVGMSCEDGTIRMSVHDPVTGKTLERHVDLRGEKASARPRLLSVSAAELVAASWIEFEVIPRPAAIIVEAQAPPAVRAEAAEVARTVTPRRLPLPWDIDAVVVGRRFAMGLHTWGGGVSATWCYQSWLALGGDLLGETGTMPISPEGASLGVLTGSGRLSARLRHAWSTLAVEGGMGGRLMMSRFRGSADEVTRPGQWQEHAFTGTWGGPLFEVRVVWKIARWGAMVFAAEGGAVTRQVAGLVAKRPDVMLDGPWAAFSIGLGAAGDAR